MTALASLNEQQQFLTFYVAGEEYAIGIHRAREILRCETITKVPGAPPAIRGVVNVRGSVVPIVDLARKFGLPSAELTKWTCIVIVEAVIDGQESQLGVLADSVSQVIDLDEEDIEPPPSFGTHADTEYLSGMGKVDDKFVLILNVGRALSMEALTLSQTLTNAPVDGDIDGDIEGAADAESGADGESDADGESNGEAATPSFETKGDGADALEQAELDSEGEPEADAPSEE